MRGETILWEKKTRSNDKNAREREGQRGRSKSGLDTVYRRKKWNMYDKIIMRRETGKLRCESYGEDKSDTCIHSKHKHQGRNVTHNITNTKRDQLQSEWSGTKEQSNRIPDEQCALAVRVNNKRQEYSWMPANKNDLLEHWWSQKQWADQTCVPDKSSERYYAFHGKTDTRLLENMKG